MLRVFKASGEEALSIRFEDMKRMFSPEAGPITVLAIKRHLQRVWGYPRFKQRLLLLDAQMLSDDVALDGPVDIQLILQPFEESTGSQIQELRQAAHENQISAMEQLLQRPQDPDEAVPSPLHFACSNGCIEATQLLLEARADTEKENDMGSTPMLFAASNGHLETVRLLLEANADKDKANHRGKTSMYAASKNGHVEVVWLLLHINADMEKPTNNDAVAPLCAASSEGHLEVVRVLLEAKADKNNANIGGKTSMHLASKNGTWKSYGCCCRSMLTWRSPPTMQLLPCTWPL